MLLLLLLSPSLIDASAVQAADPLPTLATADPLPTLASPDTAPAGPLTAANPVARINTWELVRQTTHRLLEAETQLLRYVSRYPVSAELAAKIVEEATAAGIDPELGFRLVRVESRFRPRARSPVGALGLTQLMPSTARVLDRSLRTEADILEPRTNLRLGFGYLRSMIDRYGDVRLGLLAYNRGPGTVDRALRRGQDPENGFTRRVLGTGSNRYRGEGVVSAPAATLAR